MNHKHNVISRVLAIAAVFVSTLTGCDDTLKDQPYLCLAFSSDGKSLASGRGAYKQRDVHCELRVWSVGGWDGPMKLDDGVTGAIVGVAYADDDKEIIATGNAYRVGAGNPYDGNRIYAWSSLTRQPKQAIDLRTLGRYAKNPYSPRGQIRRMAVAPKAGLAALSMQGDVPVIVDFRTKIAKYVPEGHDDQNSTSFAFSPDEKNLASCLFYEPNDKGVRKPLRVFAADTGKLIADTDAGDARPFCVGYSPDGRRLVVGCNDGEVLVFSSDLRKIEAKLRLATPDPSELKPIETGNLPLTTAAVVAVACSPKDELVAAATKDSVRLIDGKEFKVSRVLGEKLQYVRAIAFSPDGKLLAAAYGTQEVPERRMPEKSKPAGGVLVWEVQSGKLIKDLK